MASAPVLALNPNLPNLTPAEIESALPNSCEVSFLGKGGQKVVFKAKVEGNLCVLKFALIPSIINLTQAPSTVVGKRAAREVSVLGRCSSTHMVKLGPIGLSYKVVGGQQTLFFSEEFIDGKDMKCVLEDEGIQDWREVVKLALHVIDATEAMKTLGLVHRDIKPGNIMRRTTDNSYVLLDAGTAFDLFDVSISTNYPVGTYIYFSPEQFDFTNKRQLDHRSDMFSLGITLYELLTGKNPFFELGDNFPTVATKIITLSSVPPSILNPSVPTGLDAIILQMLSKFPHQRFRTFELLVQALTLLH